jgi:hypothetical protein
MTPDQPHGPSRSYIERRKKDLRHKIAALTADYGEGLTRFIHRAVETAVPRRVGGTVFRGVSDAAVAV